MKRCCIIILLLAWLAGPNAVSANEATVTASILQQDQGRNYGIMVGDLVHHRFVIRVKAPFKLIQSSLPQAGELTYWLELRDVSVSTKQSDDQTLYLIDLKYQTFYAPLDVRTLNIPAITLDFSAGDERYQLRLPDWDFTMSPIKEITPSGVGNENDVAAFMKAALAPSNFSLNELNQRITMLIVAITLILMMLLWLHGLLPKLGQSPFSEAAKQIRRRQRGGLNTNDDYLACLQAVHQAINRRAETSVFADQLDDFLILFPQFRGLRQQLREFFEQSRAAFFLDKQPAESVIQDCLNLSRQMAAADKVSAVK